MGAKTGLERRKPKRDAKKLRTELKSTNSAQKLAVTSGSDNALEEHVRTKKDVSFVHNGKKVNTMRNCCSVNSKRQLSRQQQRNIDSRNNTIQYKHINNVVLIYE